MNKWPFFSVDLEITNICGCTCIFCPREKITRPVGSMQSETFSLISRELMKIPSRIAISGMGNPLLHPEWHFFLKSYIDSGGKIGIVIPANSINEMIIEKMVFAKPTFVEVSFPTLRETILEKLIPGANAYNLIEGIRNLRKALCKSAIIINGLGTQLNLDEEKEFMTFWKKENCQGRFFACHSRGGNLDQPNLISSKFQAVKQCGLFAVHSFITWQGDLLSCCHDLTGTTKLGNILSDPHEKLLETKTNLMFNGPDFPICQKCDEPAKSRAIPANKFPENPSQKRKFLGKWAKDA
ncbi:MAG: radical SAM protein [Candidatus Riflebacteria bacterium]|nr:radical SAM protein [Candidatus Riflebacteria bacterium]